MDIDKTILKCNIVITTLCFIIAGLIALLIYSQEVERGRVSTETHFSCGQGK